MRANLFADTSCACILAASLSCGGTGGATFGKPATDAGGSDTLPACSVSEGRCCDGSPCSDGGMTDATVEASSGDAGAEDAPNSDGPLAACEAGSAQCVDGGVQTCSPAGQWAGPTACPSQVCANGACVGECPVGATQCSGSAVQTCGANNEWGAPVACTGRCRVSLRAHAVAQRSHAIGRAGARSFRRP